MIWKAAENPKPLNGTTRTKVRRAWLPTKIGSTWIWGPWLQYETLLGYSVQPFAAQLDGEVKVFEIGKWITLTKIVVKWVQA